MRKLPILITGAHRSGTTWLGKIVSLSNGVRYIHEPFNVHIQRNNNPISHVFAYLHNQSPYKYQKQVKEYILSFLTPVSYEDFWIQKYTNLKKHNTNWKKILKSVFRTATFKRPYCHYVGRMDTSDL